jgi:hypothetical protein
MLSERSSSTTGATTAPRKKEAMLEKIRYERLASEVFEKKLRDML